MIAAKLVAPVIESSFDEGFDWCVDIVKGSAYQELANELEITRSIAYLKMKDFTKVIYYHTPLTIITKHITSFKRFMDVFFNIMDVTINIFFLDTWKIDIALTAYSSLEMHDSNFQMMLKGQNLRYCSKGNLILFHMVIK